MSEDASTKIAALDGLRALAVMLVLFRHGVYLFSVYAPQSLFPAWGIQYLSFFLNGWVGVDLFFVLSGFLISRPFVGGRPFNLKIYAAKRALRIIPAYYVVLLLCVAGFFPFYNVWVGARDLPISFLYHLVFMQDYFPANINVVFWSLGVEEKFYIVAPVVVGGLLVLYRRNALLCAGALVSLVLLGAVLRYASFEAQGSPVVYSTFFMAARSPFHCCLEPLLIGVAIAFLEHHAQQQTMDMRRIARLVFYISAVALVLILAACGVLLGRIGLYDATIQPLLIAAVMGGLVWAGVMGGCPSFMSVRPLRFIARISYSLYLVHLPLWPLSFYLASRMVMADAPVLVFMTVFMGIFLALSFGAAIILYHAVERPFLTLKASFDYEKNR